MLFARRTVVARCRALCLLHKRAESSFVAPVPIKEQDAAGKLEKLERLEDLAILDQQAPNRVQTWAPSQRARSDAFNHPRFEKTALEMQPRPMAAIELIAEQPIHYIKERIAVCNGGGGPRGHPKIFINVDKPGAHACGLRYAASKSQHEALSAVGAA